MSLPKRNARVKSTNQPPVANGHELFKLLMGALPDMTVVDQNSGEITFKGSLAPDAPRPEPTNSTGNASASDVEAVNSPGVSEEQPTADAPEFAEDEVPINFFDAMKLLLQNAPPAAAAQVTSDIEGTPGEEEPMTGDGPTEDPRAKLLEALLKLTSQNASPDTPATNTAQSEEVDAPDENGDSVNSDGYVPLEFTEESDEEVDIEDLSRLQMLFPRKEPETYLDNWLDLHSAEDNTFVVVLATVPSEQFGHFETPILWALGPLRVKILLDTDAVSGSFEIDCTTPLATDIELASAQGDLKQGVPVSIDSDLTDGSLKFLLRNEREMWVRVNASALGIHYDGLYKIYTW